MAKTYKRNARGRMSLVWYQHPFVLQGVAGCLLLVGLFVRWFVLVLIGTGLQVSFLEVFSFWFLVSVVLFFVSLIVFKLYVFFKTIKTVGGYAEYTAQKKAIKAVERGLLSAGLVRKTVNESVVDVPKCEFIEDKTRTLMRVEKLPSVASVEDVSDAINSSLRKGRFADYAVSEPIQTADGLYYIFELTDVNKNLTVVPKRVNDLVSDDPYSFKLLDGQNPIYWDYPSQPHALISGQTGSYKSTFARYLIWSAAAAGCDIYILDYKRESLGLKKILGESHVVSEPDEILSLLARLVDDMTARNDKIGREIASRGVMGLNGKDLGLRPVFIFCEELGALGEALGREKSVLHSYLKNIAMVGRSSLYMLVSLLQVADVNSAPAGLRSNACLKVLLGKSTSEMITQIFSGGYADVVTKNPGRFRGWYFLSGFSTQPNLFFVPDMFKYDLDNLETLQELYEVGRKRVYKELE
jgi:hypothetical protein